MERDIIPILCRGWGKNIRCFKNSFRQHQSENGRPDYFFCFFGYFVAVEFKNGNTAIKLHEPLQDYELMRIRDANGFAFKCRSKEEVINSFKNIYKNIVKKD